MDNCNVIYKYTLSSYNMQQKGRHYTFNSYRNELGVIGGLAHKIYIIQ